MASISPSSWMICSSAVCTSRAMLRASLEKRWIQTEQEVACLHLVLFLVLAVNSDQFQNFTKLHALILAACSYALLLYQTVSLNKYIAVWTRLLANLRCSILKQCCLDSLYLLKPPILTHFWHSYYKYTILQSHIGNSNSNQGVLFYGIYHTNPVHNPYQYTTTCYPNNI